MEANAQRARSFHRIGSVALLLLALVGSASAQDVEGDKRRASALLDEGNKLFQDRFFDGAKTKFEAAYAAYPSPKILLNLAEVERELGFPDRAADNYDRFVAEAGAGIDPKFLDLARDRLAKLEVLLGRVAIEGPKGTEVKLDGRVLGRLPVPPARVAGGRHAIEAPNFREEVLTRAGHTDTIRIPDKQIAAVPPPAVAAVEGTPQIAATAAPEALVAAREEEDDDSVLGSWWFWTGVGVVAVGAVAVGVAAGSGGDDFVPSGELGRLSTGTWQTFAPGGNP